jgi:peptidoglycan/LPS O-acetylase OafA/YrhL
MNFIGIWGVNVFFAISGYLNTRSVLANQSVAAFVSGRLLRIYPALIVCVTATVVLGALLTTVSLSDYVSSPMTFDFWWRNCLLIVGIRGDLPGLFGQNSNHGVNASLWTLPHEVRLYLYLVILIAICRFRPKPCLAFIGSVIAFIVVQNVPDLDLRPGPRFAFLFASGAVVAVLASMFSLRLALLSAVLVDLALWSLHRDQTAYHLIFVIASILIGELPCPSFLRVRVDISYGFYLFACPIQQAVLLMGIGFAASFMVAALFTFSAAILSAVFVERPLLGLAVAIRPSLMDLEKRLIQRTFELVSAKTGSAATGGYVASSKSGTPKEAD